MRHGHVGRAGNVASRAARARAERLWHETVARTPEPSSVENGSNAPHLPLSPSPQGRRGNARDHAESPSPPLGEERAGVRRGRVRSSNPQRPVDGARTAPPLPGGPATRKLRALWNSAFHLGLTSERSDAALLLWLRRRADVDAAEASPPAFAHAIQALEGWLSRAAGVDWRPHLSLGRNGRVRESRRPRARVLEAQWRLLYRQGRVRIGSHAALGAYAARFAGLGRADSHLALDDAQTDALIRHLGKCIRRASESRG